jgi:glycosyltransferase involved in cell wall biosynthesis
MTNRAAARPPAVSVIICCYTTARVALLRDAVASVQAQTLPPVEIVVVVDHNPELFALAVRELRCLGVTVVESSGEPGLSDARNTGIAASRGELVAFLDDDATAEPDWLARLVAPFADPRVAVAGGAVDARWLAGRPGWFPDEFGWVVGCSYKGQPRRRAAVRNPIGCNMAFRRQRWRQPAASRAGSDAWAATRPAARRPS